MRKHNQIGLQNWSSQVVPTGRPATSNAGVRCRRTSIETPNLENALCLSVPLRFLLDLLHDELAQFFALDLQWRQRFHSSVNQRGGYFLSSKDPRQNPIVAEFLRPEL
jgi:hypothetical protein